MLPLRNEPPLTPSKPAFARELDSIYDNELTLTKVRAPARAAGNRGALQHPAVPC